MDLQLNTLAFGPLGTTELLVILAIALIIFGRRLPEVGRSLGQGIQEFKRGLRDADVNAEPPARQVYRDDYRPAVTDGREQQRPAIPPASVQDERRVSRAESVEPPAQQH